VCAGDFAGAELILARADVTDCQDSTARRLVVTHGYLHFRTGAWPASRTALSEDFEHDVPVELDQ